MAGTLTYIVAKYIPDLLRHEPRNIGVFVFGENEVAARLVGEDATGGLDLRRLPDALFNDDHAYAEWHNYWRKLLRECKDVSACRDEVLDTGTGTFTVWHGGELYPESKTVDTQAICDDLYTRLVFSLHPSMLPNAEGVVRGRTRSPELADEIENAFRAAQILAGPAELDALVPHPVRTDVSVLGTLKAPHTPRFVQDNGHRYIIEHVDFTRSPEDAREHAGYAAYMLRDIREAARDDGRSAQAIAVVNRVSNAAGPKKVESKRLTAQKYGLDALENGGVRVVPWDDLVERQNFIADRVKVAMPAV